MPRLMRFLVLACVASSPAIAGAQDAAADAATLRRLIEQTARAINSNDVQGIMAHYSKDVLVSYPGRPDATYEVFERSYREMLAPDVATSTVPTIDEILVSGDLATIRMTWDTAITDRKTGQRSTRQAKDLQVWRREGGAWKFFRGMWHHIRPDSPRATLVAISVPRLAEAIAWYREMLGMTLTHEQAYPELKLRLALLERDGMRVELVELSGSSAPSALITGFDNPAMIQGFGKIGFEVADVDAWAATLGARGVRFQVELRTNPQTGSRSFIVLDRHGNWLQFSAAR